MHLCGKKEEIGQETLGDNCLFRSVLFIGIGVSICCALWIVCLERYNLTICKTSEFFSNISEVFKFPISLAVTTFTLAGFIAVIFRSKQTATQIQETIKQNTFKNYLDHKKDFLALLNDIEEKYGVEFYNKLGLYFILFPLNTPNNFSVISKSIDSDKSPIEFWIDRFNLQMALLDSDRDLIFIASEDGDDKFVFWLYELISVMWEARIRFAPGGCSVSESFDSKKVFSRLKEWNDFPVRLHDGIINASNVFELLLNYCLPNNSSSRKFISPSVSREILDEKLQYVCGDWKIG